MTCPRAVDHVTNFVEAGLSGDASTDPVLKDVLAAPDDRQVPLGERAAGNAEKEIVIESD